MGHITNPPPSPPKGKGPERLSHKADRAYKSRETYKPYKPYKPSSPFGGIEGGLGMALVATLPEPCQ